jgi:hypothetical protein
VTRRRLLSVGLPFSLLLAACSGPTGPEAPEPAAVISLGSGTVLSGTSIEIPVEIKYAANGRERLDLLGGFEFQIAYSGSLLTFLGDVEPKEAISGWEYFTWRTGGKSPCYNCSTYVVRIVAIRELDNGVPVEPDQGYPEGELAALEFLATSNYFMIGKPTEIAFWSSECGRNVLYPQRDYNHFYIADTSFPGCDPGAAFDTMGCVRRVSLEPMLSFESGTVTIEEPEGGYEIGDIDLDGTAYRATDLAVLIDLLTQGFRPGELRRDTLMYAATDCNRDGEPLTVADYDFFTRVMLSGLDLHTPISTPYEETLTLEFDLDVDTLTITSTSSVAVSTLLLRIAGRWDGAVTAQWLQERPTPGYFTRTSDTLIYLITWPDQDMLPILPPGRSEAMWLANSAISTFEVIDAQASIAPGSPMTVDVGADPTLFQGKTMPTTNASTLR